MSEKQIAQNIGARGIKNSGRGMFKGDMKWTGKFHKFIVDSKEGKSFVLNEKTWAKICSDSMNHGPEWQPMILRVFPSGVMVACIEFGTLAELENHE